MFGGKDIHTGEIIYDDANSVRQDESKCTVSGKYFVGEKLLHKKALYIFQKNLPYVTFFATLYGMSHFL